jgi:protein SCO1
MTPRARMVAGFLLANIAVVVLVGLVLLTRPPTPPRIQGVLLPQARELPNFRLLDHHNQPFTNEDLKGHWSLVSYGFTTCPDICPTTLSQLAIVGKGLREQGHDELRVLFYTVDHRRDTVEQMASYVPFFDASFIGLTHLDDSDNPHLPFEQGLGITSQLQPLIGPGIDPADNEYEVMHGVTLFLINPQGELQAIFEPDTHPPGPENFNADTVLRDYLAIRQYLG